MADLLTSGAPKSFSQAITPIFHAFTPVHVGQRIFDIRGIHHVQASALAIHQTQFLKWNASRLQAA